MSDSDKMEKDVGITSNEYDHNTREDDVGIVNKSAALKTDLQSRHMQMIAIGGAIGAGFFISTGETLASGGPASLVIGYLIVGVMLLLTMQALGELAVMYPINGAFYTYVVRFVDPAVGFSVGWEYAIGWLTVLPFEIIAASNTVRYWNTTLNSAIFVTIFLVALCVIQIFGVRGYGEVEFILSIIKILACCGFIIFGIIVNVGGVGDKGYLGAKYWYDPGAFNNGFNGFASVFVVAAFAFGGTELVGLAAAESKNPRKALPLAAKQVFFRIFFFYVVNLFILGLIIPYNDPRLALATSTNSRFSPFTLAIADAGVKVLPSIFNAVITLSVISVANSCTFGSTRTIQAMAERGMAPKFFAYVDKAGRPIWCVALQLVFGLLGYVVDAHNGNLAFTWLLSLSGLSYFTTWGALQVAHIRFRAAWKAQGRDIREIPYRAPLGVWGSWIAFFLVCVCLIATFYNALYPTPDAVPNASSFFEVYLAAPLVIAWWLFWKVWTGNWSWYIPLKDIDLVSGAKPLDPSEFDEPTLKKAPWYMRIVRSLF
ncbi:amino-acid permease inda1 [Xylariaceae sp. FL0255]|nr:amino-acid permease inda1 [Xylariaceae sp. FL0255]